MDARVARLASPVARSRSSRRPGRCRARAPARAPTLIDGPSSGSAPAASRSGVPSTFHFSGRTTSSAPSAAASRTSRSAVARLRGIVAVELSWIAAARMRCSSPSQAIDWSVNRSREAYRPACWQPPRVSRRRQRAPRRHRRAPRADAAVPGGRLLKRWRYVGALRPETHALRRLGARSGRRGRRLGGVGPRARRLHERTRRLAAASSRRGRRGARLIVRRRRRRDRPRARRGRGRRDGTARAARVHLDAQAGRHRARGRVRVGRPPVRELDAPAFVDESAGYHARTRRGAGRPASARAADGRPLAWNLVEGDQRPAARQRADRVDRRRAVARRAGALRRRLSSDRAGRGRRASLRRRGDPRAATTTCSSCAAATSSRSAPSPARSPAASSSPRATG